MYVVKFLFFNCIKMHYLFKHLDYYSNTTGE